MASLDDPCWGLYAQRLCTADLKGVEEKSLKKDEDGQWIEHEADPTLRRVFPAIGIGSYMMGKGKSDG